MAREQLPTRSDSAKYRKARQKRQRARRMRRMESVLPGGMTLRRPALPALPALSLPATDGMRANLGEVTGSGWHWSKLLSGLVLLGALAGVFWLHWDARWFVQTGAVRFENLGYLSRADLEPQLDIEDWSIFWLKPEEVRAQILTHPYVADAQVRISLPNNVQIEVKEAEPTALWVTREGTLWLLENGSALNMRTRPGLGAESALLDTGGRRLPQIIDVNRDAQAPGKSAIDVEVLRSALALLATLPEVEELRYNSGAGLNFALPGESVYVYWGDGHDTQEKLKNLAAGQQLLRSGEASGTIIDVRYVERPFIR
jgi:hypothetical protein